jgi:hypothetical protein
MRRHERSGRWRVERERGTRDLQRRNGSPKLLCRPSLGTNLGIIASSLRSHDAPDDQVTTEVTKSDSLLSPWPDAARLSSRQVLKRTSPREALHAMPLFLASLLPIQNSNQTLQPRSSVFQYPDIVQDNRSTSICCYLLPRRLEQEANLIRTDQKVEPKVGGAWHNRDVSGPSQQIL